MMLCACFKVILCFIGLQKCRGFEKKNPRGDTRKKKTMWKNYQLWWMRNLSEEMRNSWRKKTMIRTKKQNIPTEVNLHLNMYINQNQVQAENSWVEIEGTCDSISAKISFQIAPSEISVRHFRKSPPKSPFQKSPSRSLLQKSTSKSLPQKSLSKLSQNIVAQVLSEIVSQVAT